MTAVIRATKVRNSKHLQDTMRKKIPVRPNEPPIVDSRQQRTVFIRDLADRRITVVEPIPVSVESSDGQATACCYDLEQFGAGADEFSALDDLRATVVELYFALKSESRLGPLPQRQLDYLKKVVREA